MGVSFPLFFFLCDFLGASGFFCGTGLGGGQGDACTVPPCFFFFVYSLLVCDLGRS